MRRALLALVSASLLVVGLVAPVAASDGPVITTIPVDDTAVFPAGTRCPFELHAARQGTLVIKQWFAADGTLLRETDTWTPGVIQWWNPATGKSFTTRLAGPFQYQDNLDGTATVRVPGNDQAIVIPGHGFIVGHTGITILLVDSVTGGVIDVEKLAGHQDALWPTGCQYLV
jgi:hypothetical protein